MTGHHARIQKRRLAAARLFAAGSRTIDVARELGVTWRTAHRWRKAFLEQGPEGLRVRRTPRRKRLLDEAQRRRLRAILRGDARRFGFADERWTLDRVHHVVERVFGISCSRVSVWRMLRKAQGKSGGSAPARSTPQPPVAESDATPRNNPATQPCDGILKRYPTL